MIGLIVIAPLALFLGWILKNSVTLYLGRAWPRLGHLVLQLCRVGVDAVPAVADPHRTLQPGNRHVA